jgi:uncharacterized protein YjbJ (UPF0337 family)
MCRTPRAGSTPEEKWSGLDDAPGNPWRTQRDRFAPSNINRDSGDLREIWVFLTDDNKKERTYTMSTTDKAKNKVQEAKGHAKNVAGKATHDRSLEAEGNGDKAAANLKQAGEKVKDAFKK